MKAAVVTDFKQDPKFDNQFPTPILNPDEVLINVIASSLSNRARSGAAGSHYTSTDQLPMIPGVDGIGTLPTGEQVYFASEGTFAEQVAVKKGHWVTVPDGLDAIKLAGMMNPALSSWMALNYRANFSTGQKVMILGATGNAGMMAVQIAKRLGASEIIAVARNTEKLKTLTDLGATQLVDLSAEPAQRNAQLAKAGSDVDIVLDYLWGDVAANAMTAIIPHRQNAEQLLQWVEIGSSAGQTAPIPGAGFRAVALSLIGSGQGSVAPIDMMKSLNAILTAEKEQPFTFTTRTLPLSDVEAGWHLPGNERLVFTI